jgi:4-amino-4-deoxy-L-arabinose transferase-like glycosyltransferase
MSFIIVVTVYFYWFVSLSTVPTSDGVEFLNNARSWSSGFSLNSPFRAPLISWITAGVWGIIGENWIMIKYLMPAFTPAAAIMLYLAIRKHKSKWFAFGVSALTILNSNVFFWGSFIMTEGLSLFFLSLSLYFMKSKKSSHWFLAGISIGLTFASRYTILLQAFAIFVIESLIRRNPTFFTRTLMTMLPII